MKILDLSAGRRAMWFDKDNPIVTFLDIRPEVDPTFVCDTRAIPPEVGEGFDLIVFDPPHVNFGAPAEGCTSGKKADFVAAYGHWTTDEIRDVITGSAKEAHRISSPEALMAFKWNDHDQKLEKVLALMSAWWQPLFRQRVTQRTKHASGTHWVMLRKLCNAS